MEGEQETVSKLSNDTRFNDLSDLGWLRQIFVDMKHRAVSLRQLSFLFYNAIKIICLTTYLGLKAVLLVFLLLLIVGLLKVKIKVLDLDE